MRRQVDVPTPRAPRPSLEELLGGRLLAWVGGAAVLIGLALLFALGVSSGWIGEAERCLIAAAGCAGLVGVASASTSAGAARRPREPSSPPGWPARS